MQSQEFWDHPDARKIVKAGKIAFMVVGIFLLAILLGFFVMFLWNMTVATIFGLPTITYWQAVGLFVLAKLFFGFGGGGSRHSKGHKHKRHFKKHEKELDFTSDKEFTEFWQGEGKQAYDAYLADKNSKDELRDPPQQ